MQKTMRQVMILNPDRVSLFGYAHVPWMKKHMRLIAEDSLPAKDIRYDLFQAGQTVLFENGYHAIGIDHFAKADDSLVLAHQAKKLSRNFQGYTDQDQESLIGLGASSISHFSDGYIQNFAAMPLYRQAILANKFPIQKNYRSTQEDQIRADVIKNIMCYMQVDLNDISRRYQLDDQYFQDALKILAPYLEDKLVTYQNNILNIQVEAKSLTRLIAAAFDPYWEPNQQIKRHTKAI
jgi:oxygen-independent coproporphyrinogen-3 oxidase